MLSASSIYRDMSHLAEAENPDTRFLNYTKEAYTNIVKPATDFLRPMEPKRPPEILHMKIVCLFLTEQPSRIRTKICCTLNYNFSLSRDNKILAYFLQNPEKYWLPFMLSQQEDVDPHTFDLSNFYDYRPEILDIDAYYRPTLKQMRDFLRSPFFTSGITADKLILLAKLSTRCFNTYIEDLTRSGEDVTVLLQTMMHRLLIDPKKLTSYLVKNYDDDEFLALNLLIRLLARSPTAIRENLLSALKQTLREFKRNFEVNPCWENLTVDEANMRFPQKARYCAVPLLGLVDIKESFIPPLLTLFKLKISINRTCVIVSEYNDRGGDLLCCYPGVFNDYLASAPHFADTINRYQLPIELISLERPDDAEKNTTYLLTQYCDAMKITLLACEHASPAQQEFFLWLAYKYYNSAVFYNNSLIKPNGEKHGLYKGYWKAKALIESKKLLLDQITFLVNTTHTAAAMTLLVSLEKLKNESMTHLLKQRIYIYLRDPLHLTVEQLKPHLNAKLASYYRKNFSHEDTSLYLLIKLLLLCARAEKAGSALLPAEIDHCFTMTEHTAAELLPYQEAQRLLAFFPENFLEKRSQLKVLRSLISPAQLPLFDAFLLEEGLKFFKKTTQVSSIELKDDGDCMIGIIPFLQQTFVIYPPFPLHTVAPLTFPSLPAPNEFHFESLKIVRVFGRSVEVINEKDEVFVVKIKRKHEPLSALEKEWHMNTSLETMDDIESDIPISIGIFSILLSSFMPDKTQRDCIQTETKLSDEEMEGALDVFVYKPAPGYLQYVTEVPSVILLQESLSKAARDLARLFHRGILMPQLLTLMHNVDQASERHDLGRYQLLTFLLSAVGDYPSIGRLHGVDKATNYPNIRASGLADLGDFIAIFDLLDWSEFSQFNRRFFREALKVQTTKEKATCAILMEILSEYFLVLRLLILRFGYNRPDTNWDELSDITLQLFAELSAGLMQTSVAEEKAWIDRIAKPTRMAAQAKFWLTEEYATHITEKKLPEKLYSKKTNITIADSATGFRDSGNFGRHAFFCTVPEDGRDLGPTNGPNVLTEDLRLITTIMFKITHRFSCAAADTPTAGAGAGAGAGCGAGESSRL